MRKKYVTRADPKSGHWGARDSQTGRFGGKRGEPIPPSEKGTFSGRDSRTGRFIVGREGMAKLNAIEGIKQSRSSRDMFANFERDGLSAEERRRRIVAKHVKKG